MSDLYAGLPIISWPVHPQRTRKRRPGEGAAHVLVLHTSEQPAATVATAEQLARFIGAPPTPRPGGVNQASYHWAVDLDSIAAMVPPDDIAYHAPPNWHGEAICLTGRAARDWTGTSDGVDDWPELRLAATLAGRRCWARGWPVRRLTVAQLQAGQTGICGHVDISAAFKQTDHTDPGVGFPWPAFLELVQRELDRLNAITTPVEEELMYLSVFVKGDPARAEALVAIDGAGVTMVGYNSTVDRDRIVAATKATLVEVSAGQYDDFKGHAASP